MHFTLAGRGTLDATKGQGPQRGTGRAGLNDSWSLTACMLGNMREENLIDVIIDAKPVSRLTEASRPE